MTKLWVPPRFNYGYEHNHSKGTHISTYTNLCAKNLSAYCKNSNTFLFVNSHLGAGVHQQAIQHGL